MKSGEDTTDKGGGAIDEGSTTWTLDEALVYIRYLQPRAMDAGWCIFLGGGVLNRGVSHSDLDLLAYPRTASSEREALLALLPEGQWSTVEGVSNVFTFHFGKKRLDLVFQL